MAHLGTRAQPLPAELGRHVHTGWRQPGQRLAGAQLVATQQVQATAQVKRQRAGEQPQAALQFKPAQSRAHALETVLRQHRIGRARRTGNGDVGTGGVQRDEVAETGLEQIGLEVVRTAAPGQAQFGMAAALQSHQGVANFEGARGHMQAVGIQLVVRRSALGAAPGGQQLPAGGQGGASAQRQAGGLEAAATGSAKARRGRTRRVTRGGHRDLLGARTGAHRPDAAGPLFQRKQCLRARARVRHKGLFAQGGEVQRLGLQTPHALQPGPGRVAKVQAGVLATALERGADIAVAFDFFVLVARGTGLAADAADETTGHAPLAGQGQAVALQADLHVGLHRHAVAVAQRVHGQAQVSVAAHVARAHRAAFAL